MILAVIPARGGSTIRRQDMKEIYWVNGAVYVNCVADLTKDTSFNDNPVGYVMPVERSIDIDEESDFLLAEHFMPIPTMFELLGDIGGDFMSELQIGKKKIGNGYPVYIIAEGCDNHMGDVEVAKEMCRQAKLAGADCIKFQHHLPYEEMLSDAVIAGKNNIPLYEFLKQHALTLKQHRELMEYCKKIGIQYLCTPFSLKAAYELDAMGVDAFKIGSGEMTDIPTLVRIARLGKPMIVSTGMSTIEEIRRTYDVLKDINLKFILQMEKHFPDAIIGHSDHTPDLYTSFGAVTLGARIIEKHVILDKRTPGPDQSVSIDFQELHQLVDGIRKLEDALGSVKKVHPGEEETRSWAFRSLVTKRPIKKGQRIEEDMIWSKRPGTGIPAYRMKEIIGKYAATDIDENVLLKEDDFC